MRSYPQILMDTKVDRGMGIAMTASDECLHGKKVNKIVSRAELISSHTARRTFATINANRGVDLEVIALATGHKSIAQLKNYIKSNDIQKANILENAFSKF